MAIPVYFPDTNVFLQCNALAELPWSKTISEPEIQILVAPTVQREIDRLKGDGKSRRAKRARKAAQLLRVAVRSSDQTTVIRESNPRIILGFPPVTNNQITPIAGLDMSYSDERMVGEVLIYRSEHPDEDVSLVSHDIGPLLAARRYNLKCLEVPDEWLLPPEPDESERKMAALERRLEGLESGGPRIEIVAHDATDQGITGLEFELETCRPFTRGEVQELMDAARKNFPMATDFSQDHSLDTKLLRGVMGVVQEWRPPALREIERYQNEEYPGWLEKIQEFFEGLPMELERARRQKRMQFRIKNLGNRSAEYVIVSLRTHGDVIFRPPSDGENAVIDVPPFPKAPNPPAGRFVRRASIFERQPVGHLYQEPFSISPILTDRPRDRHTFYWTPSRPSIDKSEWKLECTELRHQLRDEYFDCPLRLTANATGGGLIECSVSATNLPEPGACKIPVRINHKEGDALKIARKMVNPPPLLGIFSAAKTERNDD
jgi:PIN domain